MADPDVTESEMEAWLTQILAVHYRALLKAPMIAAMILFSVATFSGSILKGLLIGIMCLAASAFNTWRRFLEPISFWVFAMAVVVWCDPTLPNSFKSGVQQLSLLVSR